MTKTTETKESKLIKLLTDGKTHSYAQIMKVSGYAKASLDMYLSQAYLDRKGKAFKVVESTTGKDKAYHDEVKGARKGKSL